MDDLISRQAAIDALKKPHDVNLGALPTGNRSYEDIWKCVAMAYDMGAEYAVDCIVNLPSAQPEIIRCKDCKHWKQQTNYQGVPLSFGFCESDDMWRSLYGETCEVSHIDTDDDFYCGYAERRTDD